MRDRLPQLSGYTTFTSCCSGLADDSLSGCLGGRVREAPHTSPRAEELPWPHRLCPRAVGHQLHSGPSDAKDGSPFHTGEPLLALCANGQPPACLVGPGGRGAHTHQGPGPRESGCVTGQAFRGNLSHHSLLIFMTCISEIVLRVFIRCCLWCALECAYRLSEVQTSEHTSL